MTAPRPGVARAGHDTTFTVGPTVTTTFSPPSLVSFSAADLASHDGSGVAAPTALTFLEPEDPFAAWDPLDPFAEDPFATRIARILEDRDSDLPSRPSAGPSGPLLAVPARPPPKATVPLVQLDPREPGQNQTRLIWPLPRVILTPCEPSNFVPGCVMHPTTMQLNSLAFAAVFTCMMRPAPFVSLLLLPGTVPGTLGSITRRRDAPAPLKDPRSQFGMSPSRHSNSSLVSTQPDEESQNTSAQWAVHRGPGGEEIHVAGDPTGSPAPGPSTPPQKLPLVMGTYPTPSPAQQTAPESGALVSHPIARLSGQASDGMQAVNIGIDSPRNSAPMGLIPREASVLAEQHVHIQDAEATTWMCHMCYEDFPAAETDKETRKLKRNHFSTCTRRHNRVRTSGLVKTRNAILGELEETLHAEPPMQALQLMAAASGPVAGSDSEQNGEAANFPIAFDCPVRSCCDKHQHLSMSAQQALQHLTEIHGLQLVLKLEHSGEGGLIPVHPLSVPVDLCREMAMRLWQTRLLRDNLTGADDSVAGQPGPMPDSEKDMQGATQWPFAATICIWVPDPPKSSPMLLCLHVLIGDISAQTPMWRWGREQVQAAPGQELQKWIWKPCITVIAQGTAVPAFSHDLVHDHLSMYHHFF
eukprot:gene11424-311_t